MVVTTVVMGLGQATFTPFYTGEVAPFRMKMAVLAILLVAGIGWLFTGTLHRHLLTSVKSSAPPPQEAAAKPPAAVPK